MADLNGGTVLAEASAFERDEKGVEVAAHGGGVWSLEFSDLTRVVTMAISPA